MGRNGGSKETPSECVECGRVVTDAETVDDGRCRACCNPRRVGVGKCFCGIETTRPVQYAPSATVPRGGKGEG